MAAIISILYTFVIVFGIITLTGDNTDAYNSEITLIAITTVVAFVLSFLISTWLSSLTVKPINELKDRIVLVSEGDLRESDEDAVFNSDEIGELQSNFSIMKGQLRVLVKNIVDSSSLVSTSSEELVSSAEETNAAAEEVASTSQSMSTAASQQAEMIALSVQKIGEVGPIVENIIEQIQSNSEVISQIALQTNILALNAGIEASRAGDYGRGFAVVAENVRRLSDESKNAAEEITTVAESISTTLQETFDELRFRIEEVASLSEETAASAEEVAAASEEVTSSMQQVTKSSQELFDQAASSLDQFSIFQLE